MNDGNQNTGSENSVPDASTISSMSSASERSLQNSNGNIGKNANGQNNQNVHGYGNPRKTFQKGKGQQGNGNQSKRNVKKDKFKGFTSSLEGNVFQLPEESKDPMQFKNTKKAFLNNYCKEKFLVDLSSLFQKDCVQPTVLKPIKPRKVSEDDESVDSVNRDAYKEELKIYVQETRKMQLALKALYGVILGQCSPNVVARLKIATAGEKWEETGNCAKLLATLQQVTINYDHQRNKFLMMNKHIQEFYAYKQKDDQDIHVYKEVFDVMVENIEQFGGCVCYHPVFIREIMIEEEIDPNNKDLPSTVKDLYTEKAKQRFLAIQFITGANSAKYGQLITDLENSYSRGHDDYPETVDTAYRMMANYQINIKRNEHYENRGYRGRGRLGGGPPRPGLSFAQNSSVNNRTSFRNNNQAKQGRDGLVFPHITCYAYGSTGHYASQCPQTMMQFQQQPTDGYDHNRMHLGFFQYTTYNMMQSRSRYQGLNKNWILLDSQSNCDIFCNKELLKDVWHEDGALLCIHSNGGVLETKMKGMLHNYGTVWYSENSLANILALSNVRKQFDVRYTNGSKDSPPAFEVIRKDGSIMKFVEHEIGLYVYDVTQCDKSKLENQVSNFSFVNTVDDNLHCCSKKDVQKAKLAREFYIKIGRPSVKTFKHLINNNLIRECPITVDDINRAEHIFGPDIGALKGKTVRKQPPAVPLKSLIPLPAPIATWHKKVTLCTDIFF